MKSKIIKIPVILPDTSTYKFISAERVFGIRPKKISKADMNLRSCGVLFIGIGYELLFKTKARTIRKIWKNNKIIYADSYSNN